MATRRPLTEYPPEYFTLFLRACRERVLIPCGSDDAAKRFRGRLYAFRDALYDSPQQAPRQALVASLIKFSVKDGDLIAQPWEEITI